MSTKIHIASGDDFVFYYESFLDNKINEEIISTNNQPKCSIKRISTGDLSARISLPSKYMDKIAIAWIKDRKLQHIFNGSVGKEY